MPRPVAHLANLDLNLLVALRELVRERSVTRAAERLGVAGGTRAHRRSRAADRLGGQWGLEPPERWGHVRRGDAEEPVPSARRAWDLFYPAFAAAVRGAQSVPVNPWDAVATAAVLDAARTSARTAQLVTPA
jgi:hypothetical protein